MYEPTYVTVWASLEKETILAPSKEATIPKSNIREIALGIFDEITDSEAAKRYCCAKETDNPIVKLPTQKIAKLSIKIAYAHTKEKKLFIIDAREKPNLLPLTFITFDAINEPIAVPTIIRAVGNVAK